jgi:hypothetical protein
MEDHRLAVSREAIAHYFRNAIALIDSLPISFLTRMKWVIRSGPNKPVSRLCSIKGIKSVIQSPVRACCQFSGDDQKNFSRIWFLNTSFIAELRFKSGYERSNGKQVVLCSQRLLHGSGKKRLCSDRRSRVISESLMTIPGGLLD